MKRAEVYRSSDARPERGDKAGYYVVVSRNYIARSRDIDTVICAPVYSRILGVSTEITIGPGSGVPHVSSVRCDFLMLMFKSRLKYVGQLAEQDVERLDRALGAALGIDSHEHA